MGVKMTYRIDLDDYNITPNRMTLASGETVIYPIRIFREENFFENDITAAYYYDEHQDIYEGLLKNDLTAFDILSVHICLGGMGFVCKRHDNGKTCRISLELFEAGSVLELEIGRGEQKGYDHYLLEIDKNSNPEVTETHEHMQRKVVFRSVRHNIAGSRYDDLAAITEEYYI